MQTTIKKIIKMSGTGLHSGVPSNLIISPASAEYGIWFRRIDISDCAKFGNYASSKVVETFGPRLDSNGYKEVLNKLRKS